MDCNNLVVVKWRTPSIDNLMASQPEVDRILGKYTEDGIVYYLVHWKETLQEQDSWESQEALCWAGRQIHLFERNDMDTEDTPSKKVKMSLPSELRLNHPILG